MYGFTTRCLVRRHVAAALAGVLAWGILLFIPDSSTAARNGLEGAARVVDGDTLDIAGERVRLEGIDAPEMAQSCPRRFIGSWACGKAAARALEELVAGHEVGCQSHGTDKYGRMLGVCFVAGRDINAEMVREGHAWAFVKYSTSYVGEEARARALRIGIWQGDAEPAWVYRDKRWAGAEQAAPRGCAIKGNVTEHGHIYHTPWSPWYDKVKIDEQNGERWFCSESEALAAGWRPAAVH
jgi:endonuclease YncB( thermonuclease family)